MNLQQFDSAILVGGMLLLTVLVFIIFREVALWYFRINERTKLMRGILNELKKMNNED